MCSRNKCGMIKANTYKPICQQIKKFIYIFILFCAWGTHFSLSSSSPRFVFVCLFHAHSLYILYVFIYRSACIYAITIDSLYSFLLFLGCFSFPTLVFALFLSLSSFFFFFASSTLTFVCESMILMTYICIYAQTECRFDLLRTPHPDELFVFCQAKACERKRNSVKQSWERENDLSAYTQQSVQTKFKTNEYVTAADWKKTVMNRAWVKKKHECNRWSKRGHKERRPKKSSITNCEAKKTTHSQEVGKNNMAHAAEKTYSTSQFYGDIVKGAHIIRFANGSVKRASHCFHIRM